MSLTNLNLRLQRSEADPEGLLLQYVSSGANGIDSPKDLSMRALRAHYLAFACQQHPERYSFEEMQQIGIMCCQMLQDQILAIRSTLKLPAPHQPIATQPATSHNEPAKQEASPAPTPSPSEENQGLGMGALNGWGS